MFDYDNEHTFLVKQTMVNNIDITMSYVLSTIF